MKIFENGGVLWHLHFSLRSLIVNRGAVKILLYKV